MTRLFSLALVAIATAAFSGQARADRNDLVLSRLGTISNGTVIGNNLQFRSLASQLGVVMAPRITEPADTLGFGGFEFSADIAFTSISNNAAYWQVLESSQGPTASTHGNGAMTTTGLFVKKGLWLPLPSFEMGIGAVHLGESHLWASQGYVKFGLHEGYHDMPIPSIAVRGAASRIMGSEQIDLTVASVDVTASKDIGIAGVVRVSPYLGWNWLIIVPRSEVIDRTPDIDLRDDPSDAAMNFVFQDQDDIIRNRIFFGAKVRYHIFTLGLHTAIAFAGSSVDDVPGTAMNCKDVNPSTPTTACDSTDEAGSQTTFTTTLGLNF